MKTIHNNHLISNNKELKYKGVMVRKWDYNKSGEYYNPSKKNLCKQIKTLHNKLKKNDIVYTEYAIEKDRNENKYHIHMIVNYTDEANLNHTLSKYIGGNEWIKRNVGLDTFDECNGKFGLIHTEEIINISKYRGYINKYDLSTTLI